MWCLVLGLYQQQTLKTNYPIDKLHLPFIYAVISEAN